MKFIDTANSCCGRYEGGENPYFLACALCDRTTNTGGSTWNIFGQTNSG